MTHTKETLTAEIRRFLATRPGFDPGNYATMRDYRADVRSATADRTDAETMLRAIELSTTVTVDMMLAAMPSRLTLDSKGQLDYTAGQYYCTEYRRWVAGWMSSVLWAFYRDHCAADTHEKIQACAARAFRSRRIRRYFN